MLRRTRQDLTLNAANVMYRCLIRPIFDYSDSVWTCCNKTDADSLERVDDDMHVYKLVNKCLKGNVPQILMDYFKFNRDRVSRSTRQNNQLHVPRVKLEAGKKSFYYNGCVVFNKFSDVTDA
jgi:hypothetical protein